MKNEKLLLLLFAAINFTHIMDFMIMMPLGDILMRLFKINPQQFSLLVSAYTLSAGVSSFAGAFFIDNFDRKKALLFVYAGFALGTIACALAPNYYFLLLTRSLTGLFGGLIGALVMSIVSDMIPFERRGRAMGILATSFSAAAVFGVPFGLYLTNLFSWHAPFYFLGSLALGLLLTVYVCMPAMATHIQQREKRQNPLEVLGIIFSNTNHINALFLGVFMIVGHFMIVPFVAPYMTRNVGFRQEDITYIYLCGGAMTIFTAPLIGRITDKIGGLRILLILVPVSFIPVLLMTNMTQTPLVLALLVTSAFFIFGSGRFIPAQTLVSAAINPAYRGSFMSFKSSAEQLAVGFSSFIAGLIVVESAEGTLLYYNYVGFIAISISCIALWIATQIRLLEGKIVEKEKA